MAQGVEPPERGRLRVRPGLIPRGAPAAPSSCGTCGGKQTAKAARSSSSYGANAPDRSAGPRSPPQPSSIDDARAASGWRTATDCAIRFPGDCASRDSAPLSGDRDRVLHQRARTGCELVEQIARIVPVGPTRFLPVRASSSSTAPAARRRRTGSLPPPPSPAKWSGTTMEGHFRALTFVGIDVPLDEAPNRGGLVGRTRSDTFTAERSARSPITWCRSAHRVVFGGRIPGLALRPGFRLKPEVRRSSLRARETT
jgi:hypothetical protein